MFRSAIDTPWTFINGGYAPELPNDPLGAGIKSWRDITGAEGVWIESISERLYGGNYAKQTGIQPDYRVGRLGGSGDPDWLTIEAITETTDELSAIEQDSRFMVFWTEEILEGDGPTTLQTNSNRYEQPPGPLFGQWRATMAQRGIRQEWIDQYLGTAVNARSRNIIQNDVCRGYIGGQY